MCIRKKHKVRRFCTLIFNNSNIIFHLFSANIANIILSPSTMCLAQHDCMSLCNVNDKLIFIKSNLMIEMSYFSDLFVMLQNT